MKIFKNNVDFILDSPLMKDHDNYVLLGFSLTEGVYECCGTPVIAFEMGFLFFTITITISEYKKH